MSAYNCTECQDTGKRILPNGEHSNCLDCSCEATTERAAMDLAAMDYIQAYQGDLQHAPEDVRWFVHQRAVKMQAARIAELESRIEFNGDHSQDGIVKRDERIADLERQLRNAKFAENLDAEDKAFFASLRAPSAPAVGKLVSIDEMCKILDAALIKSTERTDCTILYTVTFDQLRSLYMKGMAFAPQAADTDKVRERFEQWAAKQHPPYQLKLNKWRLNEGSRWYDSERTEHTYQGFAAALTTMAAQAPVREVPEDTRKAIEQMHHALSVAEGYMDAVCFNTTNPKKRNNYAGGLRIIRDAMSAYEALSLPAAPVQQEGDL